MFGVITSAVPPPTLGFMFARPENGMSLTAYMATHKFTDRTLASIVGGMIIILARLAKSDDPDVYQNMFQAGAADMILDTYQRFKDTATVKNAALTAYVMGGQLGQAPADLNDEEEFAELVEAQLLGAPNWLINNVSAAKKKPLTLSNVNGFFASIGMSNMKLTGIDGFFNKVAMFCSDNIADGEFRALLIDNVWGAYRSTRVSTGIVISKLLGEFVEMGILHDGGADYRKIETASRQPWNVAASNDIPEKYKAYAMLFLETAGTPIDSWYQGQKAVSNMPAIRVRTTKHIFKKYMEIKSNVGAVDAATSMAEFQAAVAGHF